MGDLEKGEERARSTARIVAIVLLLLFVIQGLSRLFAPSGYVVQLSDAAFANFALAKNLALGVGFTLDGVHTATGSSPLWVLVLTPFAFVLGGGALPLLSSILGLLLLVASAYLVVRLLERHVPFDLAVALGLFFLSRPGLIVLATDGEGSALSLLGVLLWAEFALPRPNVQATPPLARAALMSLFLPWLAPGLVLLPLGAAIFAGVLHLRGLERNRWQVPLVAFLAATSGFVLLRLLFLGAALPAGLLAVPWSVQELFWSNEPDSELVLQRYASLARPLLLGEAFGVASNVFGAMAAWLVLAPLARIRRWLPLVVTVLLSLLGILQAEVATLGALLLFVAPKLPAQLWRSTLLTGFGAGWVAFLLVALLHLLIRQQVSSSDFLLAALPGVFGLAYLLSHLRVGEGLLALVPEARRRQLVWLLLAVLALFDLGQGARVHLEHQERERVARIVPELAAEGSAAPAIASFRPGVLAWAGPGAVLDLSGRFAPPALEAAGASRLLAWAAGLDFALIVESPDLLEDEDPNRVFPQARGGQLGPRGYEELEPRASFDLPAIRGGRPGSDLVLLAHVPGGAAAPLETTPRVLRTGDGARFVVLPAEWLAGGDPLILESDAGQQLPSFERAAKLAPHVVFPLPAGSGRLRRGRETLLAW